jgi:hypothetical protein
MTPQTTPSGRLIIYSLFDLGESIDLAGAERRFAERAVTRQRPRRLEAQTIRIPEPPLIVALPPGEAAAAVPAGWQLRTSACLYDFGVVSLRYRLEWPPETPWEAFREDAAALIHATSFTDAARGDALELGRALGDAVREPEPMRVHEDYAILRWIMPAQPVSDDDLAWLLLHEARPLVTQSREMLLGRDFRYTAEDRAVVAYDAALVVEPDADDEDVEFLLEFANAQLLELKVYDALLDTRLPTLELRATSLPRQPLRFLSRQFQPLIAEFYALATTTSRLIERADNALRITDDVYLARIYRAALDVMNEPAWRRSVERKLTLARDAAEGLNGLAAASRAELLEIIIVLLILTELVVALF